MTPDEQSNASEPRQGVSPPDVRPEAGGVPEGGGTSPEAARPGPAAETEAAGESSSGESPAGDAVAPGLETEIEALRAQVAELNDRYVRAMAEMENVRRRSAEEVSKARKFALESFAEALLPVKDSLDLALKVETPTLESLREGTEATMRQLDAAFERNHLTAIDPLGERFDPNLHQAISMVPADKTDPPVAPGHVASVLQRGYLIHERVLRPALVMVVQG